jgi:HK97 family phage major capsid protein
MKTKAQELLTKATKQATLRIVPADQVGTLRKGEFDITDQPSHPPNAKPELLQKADDIYIVSRILEKDPRELKLWKQYEPQMSELRKAGMDSGAGTGAEWIPTELSSEIIRMIELQLKVAAIFRRINMPTPTFEIPAKRSRSEARLNSASGSTDAQSFTTAKVTLSAVTLLTYIPLTYEMDEDSIVPMLPEIKADISEGFAVAYEKAIISGDAGTAAAHQDADVTNDYDCRCAWDGLRLLCPDVSKVDFGGNIVNTNRARSIALNMGVYGKDINNLVWVTSLDAYHQLRNTNEVITVDKYGPQATILKGEMGKFDGVPLVVSEHVPTNLDATGVNSGTYTDDIKTILILVRKDGWVIGDRRKLLLETDKDILNQLTQVVGSTRSDFEARYDVSTEAIVGIGFNIKTGALQ